MMAEPIKPTEVFLSNGEISLPILSIDPPCEILGEWDVHGNFLEYTEEYSDYLTTNQDLKLACAFDNSSLAHELLIARKKLTLRMKDMVVENIHLSCIHPTAINLELTISRGGITGIFYGQKFKDLVQEQYTQAIKEFGESLFARYRVNA